MRPHVISAIWRAAIPAALMTRTMAAQGLIETAPDSVVRDSALIETEEGPIRVDVITRGLAIPVALAFLPDGRALVGERPSGRISLLDLRTGILEQVRGVPRAYGQFDGGMLDIAVHPGFDRNRLIFFSYAIRTPDGTATVVDRARLEGGRLAGVKRLFQTRPLSDSSFHFGSRLALKDDYLFISVGDRDEREQAQDLKSDNGKILRLRQDGRIPADNPFTGRRDVLPEIWSYGHRNPQGLALDPAGALWEHEHGPMGGDEVNLIRPGANYGWPVITYGREYSGEPVGQGITQQDGMEQPIHYWVPSIAPSGMEIYTGSAFPRWRGNLFIGAMAKRHLNRLVIQNGKVAREERLLAGRIGRVRVVRQGRDGYLYLGTDLGLILRLRPPS